MAPVYSMVYYHGEPPFGSTALQSAYDPDSIMEDLYQNGPQLIDVHRLNQHQIKSDNFMSLLIYFHQILYDPCLVDKINEMQDTLKNTAKLDNGFSLGILLNYLSVVGKFSEAEMISMREFVHSIQPSTQPGDHNMSLFEYLEREARKSGLEQGIERGIAEGEKHSQELVIRNCLAQNIDVDIIARIVGLSTDVVKSISKKVVATAY